MEEKSKLQLENECLLNYSKAQMIQKYIDELEENCTLSDLWCKSQEENKRLNNIINELKINLRQKGIEITIYDQPNYEKISGYVSITMTPEQLKKELKGDKNNDN